MRIHVAGPPSCCLRLIPGHVAEPGPEDENPEQHPDLLRPQSRRLEQRGRELQTLTFEAVRHERA